MTRLSAFKTFVAGTALALALPASQAIAHGSMKPQHGGQVALAGETVIELVRGARGVTVYLSDEDQPVPAADFTGKLIVTQGAKKKEVPLTSGPADQLRAPGARIASGSKVTVSLLSKSTQARSAVSLIAK
jgi:hypothetical protein